MNKKVIFGIIIIGVAVGGFFLYKKFGQKKVRNEINNARIERGEINGPAIPTQFIQ